MSTVACYSSGLRGRGAVYRRALAAARATGGRVVAGPGVPSRPGRAAPPTRPPAPDLPPDTELVVRPASHVHGSAARDVRDAALLEGATATVWLVSPLSCEEPRGPVLAAVALDDETPGLDRAVLETASLVAFIESLPLTVVHTWTFLGESIVACSVRGIGPWRTRRLVRRLGREREERLQALLAGAGLSPDTPRLVLKAAPAAGIRAAIRTTHASVLVLGYRGRRGLARWLHPNLAESFVGIPDLSLVAVRAEAS